MPITPLSTLPLADSPYLSRVSSNYVNKRYYMLAFNPGYALQAAELNEIQELFHINQSLSNRYPNLWLTSGFLRAGFWDGFVPYDPLYVTISLVSVANSVTTFSLDIRPGWYLWSDNTSYGGSGLNFWIYNNIPLTNTFSSVGIEYFGIFLRKKTVKCCQSSPCNPDDDDTLRDNFMEFTCGSSRLGLDIRGDSASRTTLTAREADGYDFYPILSVTTQGNTASFRFIDNQIIQPT